MRSMAEFGGKKLVKYVGSRVKRTKLEKEMNCVDGRNTYLLLLFLPILDVEMNSNVKRRSECLR